MIRAVRTLVILGVALFAATEALAAKSQYVVQQPGIYIGKNSLGGRHCFVHVLKWSPSEIVVKTKTTSSDWSKELKFLAATDEKDRTVFLKNPGRFTPKTLGIRYRKTSRVATIRNNDQKTLCKNLQLAH